MDWRKRYQRLEENIPGMVFSLNFSADRCYSFKYVSRDSLELIGLGPEDLLADVDLFLRLIHPADRQRYEQSLMQSAIAFSPWREELRLVVNGQVRWYDCLARPEPGAEGAVCWHGLVLDITARKEAEKAQIRTTNLLDGIFSQNPCPMWLADRNGGLVRMNRACREILQQFGHGAAGPYNILLDQRIRHQGHLAMVRAVFDEGKTALFVLALEEDAERGAVFEVTMAPIRDDQGVVSSAIVMYNDITERLRTEMDLRLTQFCIDQADIGIFRIDEPDGRILCANRHACRSLGYRLEELASMTVFDIDPTLTPERWLELRRNLHGRHGGMFETMHRRKDGTLFPVEISVSFLEFEGKAYSCSFAIDISARKKPEALQK